MLLIEVYTKIEESTKVRVIIRSFVGVGGERYGNASRRRALRNG